MRNAPFFKRLALAATLMFSAACSDVLAPDGARRLSPSEPNPTLIGVSSTDPFAQYRTLGNFVRGNIRGLNQQGQVTGMLIALPFSSTDYKPYRWSPGTGIEKISDAGNTQWGADINDAGVVAGTNQINVNSDRGFRAVGTTMVRLPILPSALSFYSARAVAINNAGQIVGWSDVEPPARHAVLWDASNAIQDLGTLGGSNSMAIDINNSGEVIGVSQIAGNAEWRFFRWTAGGGMQDLTPVLGAATKLVEINDAGQIIGAFTAASGQTHAFIYTPGSGVLDLGTLGGTFSTATGLNNNGQVVGLSTLADGSTHSFLWTPTDGMEDITALTGVGPVIRLNDNLQTVTGAINDEPGYSAGVSEFPQIVQLRVVPNAAPVARFTWSCSGTTCTLDATTSSDDKSVVSYAWDLNKFPGGSATGANVTVVYPHEGTRYVKLTVTDASGLTNSVTHTLPIGEPPPPPNQAPVAQFTASCTNLNCTFDSAGSSDDVGITSRSWNFGDGGTAGDVVAPSQSYASAGTYNVTLTVTDAGGLSNSTTTQVTVTPPPDLAPVAKFDFSCTGTTCTFDASASTDDNGIVSYFWDLNRFPGGSATGVTTTTTYAHGGTRYVTLRVVDAKGQWNDLTQTIEIP